MTRRSHKILPNVTAAIAILALVAFVAHFVNASFAQAVSSRKAMIGQMLMLGFPGSNPNGSWPRRLAAQIRRGEVGGVVMLGYNFKTRDKVKGLTALFRRAAGKRKLFLAVDMEGGAVQRLGRKLGYPAIASARKVATTQTLKQAMRTFGKLATISRDAGFNMNLGPVVDLLISRENPVIGKWNRAFSADPAVVTKYARAFVTAHRKLGIVAVLKHFPGHGSSTSDSHVGFVDITHSWRAKELKPFAQLIASGYAPAIMPGHLIHKKIASDGVPVSISKRAISGLLRTKLKYRGLIISDDLHMGAITKNYSYKTAVIRAVNAGVDVLMISNSAKPDRNLPRKTIAIISKAVDQGKISEATIKAAYKRIMRAKAMIRSR